MAVGIHEVELEDGMKLAVVLEEVVSVAALAAWIAKVIRLSDTVTLCWRCNCAEVVGELLHWLRLRGTGVIDWSIYFTICQSNPVRS